MSACDNCDRENVRRLPCKVEAFGIDAETLMLCQECGGWEDAEYVDFLIERLDTLTKLCQTTRERVSGSWLAEMERNRRIAVARA